MLTGCGCMVQTTASPIWSPTTRVEGPRVQATRAFLRNFSRLSATPFALWDERLSTAAVERELIAADASRNKRKAVVDQHAAVYILQGAIDRLAWMAD